MALEGVRKEDAMDEAVSTENTSTIVQHSPLSPPPPPLSCHLPVESSKADAALGIDSSSASELTDDDSSTAGQLFLFGSGAYGMMAGIPVRPAAASSTVHQPSSSDVEAVVRAATAVPSLAHTRVASISLGANHALLTTDSGATLAWGDNYEGQLGMGNRTAQSSPTAIPALDGRYITGLSAAFGHSAAVSGRGELYTWGNGELGQLGANQKDTGLHRWDLSTHSAPTLVKQLAGQRVVKVRTGDDFTIALTETGALFGCGDAHRGTLGLEQGRGWSTWNEERHAVGVFAPIASLLPLPILDIAAGSHHTLALTAAGEVYSFGVGRRGQLGHANNASQLLPKRIEALERVRVVRVYAAGDSSAVLSDEGEVWVFGNNTHGQLGVGDADSRYIPVRVKDGLEGRRVVDVAMGQGHTLLLTDDHTVLAMGDNSLGALGLASEEREDDPSTGAQDGGEEGGNKRQKMTDVDGTASADVLTPRVVPLPHGRRVISIAAGSTSSAVVLSFATSCTPLPLIAFPPTLSSYGMLHFDMEAFQHAIDSARQSSSYASLLAYINRIFSSPTVLNMSFFPSHNRSRLTANPPLSRQLSLTNPDPELLATTLPNSLLSPSRRTHLAVLPTSIDVEVVEEVYKLILRESVVEPKLVSQCNHAIHTAVNSLLERMKQPHPPADALAYRAVAIAMQAPFLSAVSDSDVMLLTDMAKVLERLSLPVRKVMRRWFTSYPVDIFGSRLVAMIIKAITTTLRNQRSSRIHEVPIGQPVPRVVMPNDEVQALTRLLALLKEASDLAGGMLRDDRWYVAVGQFIDLSEDFIRFISKQPTQAMLPAFSFCRFPFVLDPPTKTAVLRIEHYSWQRQHIYNAMQAQQQPYVTLRVDRQRLVDSTVNELNRYSAVELQRPLRVEFVGEEGVDQGGVSAEFFRLVVSAFMSEQHLLFEYNEEMRHLWFNAEQADVSKLDFYYLCGCVIGLAAYNAHSINITFPSIFYKQLLNTPIDGEQTPPSSSYAHATSSASSASSAPIYSLADLHSLDPRLVQSLQQLLAYSDSDLEDVFALTFTATQQVRTRNAAGESVLSIRTVDLIPNGSQTPVTQLNKVQFVTLTTQYLLSTSIRPQQQSFIRGFRSVCQGRAMGMFSPADLQQLLVGQPHFNWKELKLTARYEGGYRHDSPCVQWLWQLLEEELSVEERMRFLTFLTGSSRAPLGGLGELRVCVQRAGPDTEQLMSASTCYHTLLLPEYDSKDKLTRKLRKALEYAEGFGLQ